MPTQQNQTGQGGQADTPSTVIKPADPHAPHSASKVVLNKEIFCAACQTKTSQKLSLDKNNEIVATCDCGRALKFPMFSTAAEFDAHLAAHHKSNTGQVTTEQTEAERAAYDERFKKLMGVS